MANKKARTAIPPEVVAAVLHASDHTCCICAEPGKQIQIHHIDEDASNNDPSNLVVLCVEDHNRAHLSGGFGRHLNASRITHHRDEWHAPQCLQLHT
jgi:5-methylcytosine-specific restriction endonuclease McrA